jgi:hypothetical protein
MTINEDKGVDLTTLMVSGPTEAVLRAMRLAPSGGNIQPWRLVVVTNRIIKVCVVRERTSLMDVAFRGTWVALGAVIFNARVAAAHLGLHARITEFPEGPDSDVVVQIKLLDGITEPQLVNMHEAMLRRETNRYVGEICEFDDATIDRLRRAAAFGGGHIHFITDRVNVATVADILAESDRIRYLSPVLHRQMMAELVNGPSGLGIEVDTLALKSHELPVLDILRRAEVMAYAAELDQQPGVTIGTSLGDNTRDRVNASSGVLVVTVNGARPHDYISGGIALESLWTAACAAGLGVQPVSPVFLYAHTLEELHNQSPQYGDELAELQRRFAKVAGLLPHESPILVLRVSHGVPKPVRSRRLSDEWVVVDER